MKPDYFYKTFFSLAIALVLQNVVTLSVNLLDNVMLGAYSETSLAGAASVNQIQFILQQLTLALGETFVVIGAQYWGEQRPESIKRLAPTMMYLSVITSAVLFALVSLFPDRALAMFTTDAAIASEGMRYLSIIRYTYLIFMITQALLSILRSTEVVKISFYLSVLALFVNCGINYVLIFGRLGAPAMGIRGAAIGTLTARVLELIVLIIYIAKVNNPLGIRLGDLLRIDIEESKRYVAVWIPILFARLIWGINTAMQTMILGHMTDAAIAANSIANNLYLLVKSTAVGTAAATAIMIGKAVGEGDMAVIRQMTVRFQKLFVIIGIASGSFMYLVRLPLLSLYDIKPETYALTDAFLVILCVINAFMTYQMPVSAGIVRGGGNPEYVARVDTAGFVVGAVSSLLAAFVFHASPIVVVITLNIDQVLKCVPNFFKVNSYSWIKKQTA